MARNGRRGAPALSTKSGTGPTCAIELPALRAGLSVDDADLRRRITAALMAGGVTALSEDVPDQGRNGAEPMDAAVIAADGLGPAEIASIARVKEERPEAKVVIVVPWLTQKSAVGAIEGGADAVVLEDQVEEALLLAVRGACAGQISLPQDWRARVGGPVLSTRQKQILGMVILGFTNGQIARKLHVAETTVKSHLSSAFRKLGVRSRNEAAALILDPDNGLGTGILEITTIGAESEGGA